VEETSELRAAIEDLYVAFASYPLRDDTNPCACCHSPEEEKHLHSASLRKLSTEHLQQYATDALLVWGSEPDFKHFLPRIFELEVANGWEFVDPEVVFNKLHHGEWRYWPEIEQQAIEKFFAALWACILDGQPHHEYGWEIEGWLCGIAQAVSNLSPYLEAWAGTQTKNANLNLASFITETDFADPNSRPAGYWQERAELFAQVGAWVRGDVVRAKMKTIAANYPEYDFVERAYVSLP
jgi:hypothetical protein